MFECACGYVEDAICQACIGLVLLAYLTLQLPLHGAKDVLCPSLEMHVYITDAYT